MDSRNKKAQKSWRPEFETTRTCELLSRLADEPDEETERISTNADIEDVGLVKERPKD